MKYALIGCGRIAVNHIKAALNNRLEIVAVCDVLPEKMDALLAKYDLAGDPSIKRYTDYRQMLSENELTLVSIATESGLHAQIALDCIDAGVNVIIEKPMAMNMADAEEIIRRSDAKGVKVAACHQNRFNVAVQETRRALEAGRFGRLSHGSIHVRWNRNRDYYDQAPWRGTWAQDGGCLMNQCIHGIDLLRWMMGDEVEEVYGVTRQQFHDYLEAEDVGLAVVKFKNGAVGTIEGTTNVYPKNLEETLYLFGEQGQNRRHFHQQHRCLAVRGRGGRRCGQAGLAGSHQQCLRQRPHQPVRRHDGGHRAKPQALRGRGGRPQCSGDGAGHLQEPEDRRAGEAAPSGLCQHGYGRGIYFRKGIKTYGLAQDTL